MKSLVTSLLLVFSFLCATVDSELGRILDHAVHAARSSEPPFLRAPPNGDYIRLRSRSSGYYYEHYSHDADGDYDLEDVTEAERPGGYYPDYDYRYGHHGVHRGPRVKRDKRETIRFENDVVVVIPDNYSIHEPPPTKNGTPTQVDFYILIIDIRDINEVQEEMTLEMNMQIYWKDSRLSHWAQPDRKSKSRFGVLNPQLVKDIWHPDVFIDHIKKIDQPRVISTPASLRFYYKDSSFRYSGRYTMKIGCQMVFQLYPADTQRCGIEVKSYSYSNDTLLLQWRDKKPPAVKKGLELPNFKLALGQQEEFSLITSSSNYSGIRFAVLRRHLGFHLIQTYLLSCLFVILSFLTFLVAHESVLECMALCMTTLLTLTAMFAAVKQNTPTVSYVKGLDIWMVTCIFSVFFTLVDHTILLRMRSGAIYSPKKAMANAMAVMTLPLTAGAQTARARRKSIFSIWDRRRSEKMIAKNRSNKHSNSNSNGSIRRSGTGLSDPDPYELTMAYHKCNSKCKEQGSGASNSGSSGENSPTLEIRRTRSNSRAERERTSSYTNALWANDFISPLPTLSPSITPTLSPVRTSRTSSFRVSRLSEALIEDRHRSQSQHTLGGGGQCNGGDTLARARERPSQRSVHRSKFWRSSQRQNFGQSTNPFISEPQLSTRRKTRWRSPCPNLCHRFVSSSRVQIFFSKFLIPISFIIFNCIYWPWLLMSADYYNNTEFKNTKYV